METSFQQGSLTKRNLRLATISRVSYTVLSQKSFQLERILEFG